MRNWRIGTVTAGILLITMGLLWILSNMIDLSLGTLISIGWPILLILLGIEIILHHVLRKETPLRFDGFSIFLVFAVGMISVVLYSFQSVNFFSHISTSYTSNPHPISDTIPLSEEIREIVLDIPNGDVTINGVETDAVTYDGFAYVGVDSMQEAEKQIKDAIQWRTEGDTLIIEMKSNQQSPFFKWNTFHVEVTLDVPEDVYIVTDMSNGKLNVSNLKNGADLSLTNGKIEGVDISEGLKVKSSNGTITLDSITGKIEANTTNGNIQVSSAKGELLAKTTNGPIRVEDVVLSSTSDITSTNGSITVNLAETTDLAIDAKTTNGSIRGNVNWDSQDKDNKKNYVKFGSGTNKLLLTTTNGSVTVDVK